MKMKKHLTLVLSLILIVCMAMFFVACGDDNGGGGKDPSSPTNPTVTLSRKNLAMILGDEALLSAVITNGQDDYSLTWATSDASVVSVEDGNLEALKQGNAQITATYSNGTNTYTDSAQIAVTLGDNIPVLFIENKTSNDWNFVTGSEFELVPFVQFNNKKFYDVSLSIKSSDNNVIGVEGNKLLILAQGTAKLEIVATWRGETFDGRNLLKLPDVDVNVVNDVQMALNGDTVKDVQLYTRNEFYGVEYDTFTDFVLTVKKNGVDSNLPVSVEIANEKIAKYENGKITQVGFGETVATLTWTSEDNDVYQRTVKIYVDRPIVKYDQVIDNFSAADGAAMANLNGSFKETTLSTLIYGSNSAVLVDASQKYIDVYSASEVVAPLKVEDNRVMGVYTHHTGPYDVELTIGTATEQYIIDVKASTKLFAQSNINEWNDTFAVANSVNFSSKYRYGYFALLEDVSGVSIGAYNDTKFAGTFDGRGHVFSDIDILGSYGLFSSVAIEGNTSKLHKVSGTRIENVAFTNVTFKSTYGNYLLADALASSSSNPVTVENVYVQINEQPTFVRNTAALTRYCYYNKFSNLIVEYPLADTFIAPDIQNDLDNFKTSYEGHGSLFSRHFTERDGGSYNGNNVYVISTLQLSINNCIIDDDPNTITPYYNSIDASNIESTAHKAQGYYRYETIADMKAANNDYTSFVEGGNGCWTILDGIPTFRSLVQSVYLKDAGDNDLTSVTVYSANDTFTAGIIDNEGEELEGVVITANDSRIKINGNVITVEDGFYSAMLTVSSADGVISKAFPVLVNTNAPVDFNEELLLNKADNKIYFNGTSLEDTQIYAAFYNGTLVYNNDKILTSLIDKPVNTAFTLKVYTLDGCYNFTNVKMYDQVWENTKSSRVAMVNFFRTTGASRTLDGYYVLAENLTFYHGDEVGKINTTFNDFEMFGKNTQLTSTYDFNVFSGTLDGRGYTLNDIGLYAGAWSGMFGIAGDGVTIKNIAFSQSCVYSTGTNVNRTSNFPTLMFYKPESMTANIYFENVYVDLDLIGKTRSNYPVGGGDGAIVFYKVADGNSHYGSTWPDDCGLGNLKWNNVLFDVQYTASSGEIDAGYDYCDKSILCGLGTIYGFKTDDVVKNTYFITNGNEGRSISEVTASADADIIKYASMSEMISANNNYDSFDSKYWNTITGVPMWKTTNDIPYVQDAEGNYVESIIFDVDGATEGLTFTAGVFSALGNTTPVITCDNPNVVINGNSIVVNPGVYSAIITVANVAGTEVIAYKVEVNTSLSVAFTEQVLLEKTSGKIFFQGTSLEGTEAFVDTVKIDINQACATSFVLSGVSINGQKYKLTNTIMYDKVWENTSESRQDMAAFFSTYTGAGAGGPKELKTLDGYYALAEDLVFVNVASEEVQEYTFKETFYSEPTHANTFAGTFDGRGFAMYNSGAYGKGGMFGLLGSNATIKNVAIINPVTYAGGDSPSGFSIKAHRYGVSSVILFHGANVNTGLTNINISDVYVEYTTAHTSNESVFVIGNVSNLLTAENQVSINNFIVNRLFIEEDYTPTTWVDENADGRHDIATNALFGEWSPTRTLGANVSVTNTYMLTFGRTCGAGSWHMDNFVWYNSYETFAAAASTLNLTSFANSNWTMAEGSAPTWASLAD